MSEGIPVGGSTIPRYDTVVGAHGSIFEVVQKPDSCVYLRYRDWQHAWWTLIFKDVLYCELHSPLYGFETSGMLIQELSPRMRELEIVEKLQDDAIPLYEYKIREHVEEFVLMVIVAGGYEAIPGPEPSEAERAFD